jgi:hypothetical protein
MKGLLNQASNAAVKTKGSIFEFIYRRLVFGSAMLRPLELSRTVFVD